jgi:diaminohydroxyphosphoribosylaminopyrimidine deaminase/5-amino-6-(5-phosphoribosylamino)uracil reductase
VVLGAIDPNPVHEGKGVGILERAGIKVETGVLGDEATAMNEAFNHWIVHRTPLVTVKAAMTLDGKIATANAESKWITGEKARAEGMKMRRGADAILVGVNTILADNPSLTVRSATGKADDRTRSLRRIILDSQGRTPLMAQVVADEWAANTAIVVSRKAKSSALKALGEKVQVWVAPENKGQIDLRWLLKKLGAENVTSLLVEGGGEVNASFLLAGMAHRVAFFYALKVIGGDEAIKAVGGDGLSGASEWLRLRDVEWKNMGADLMLRARTGQ